jgi:hypothetical protein
VGDLVVGRQPVRALTWPSGRAATRISSSVVGQHGGRDLAIGQDERQRPPLPSAARCFLVVNPPRGAADPVISGFSSELSCRSTVRTTKRLLVRRDR